MEITPLGERLRQLRKIHNYSQQIVADKLNVIRQTYSHYETGRNYPNAEILYKLSKLYGIPVESLIVSNNDNETYSNDILDNNSIVDINKITNFAEEKDLKNLSNFEIKLLFYFDKLDVFEQEDIIDFIKSRASRTDINKKS